MAKYDVQVSIATAEDILQHWTEADAPVTPDESAVVRVDGTIVAFTDEYGTATVVSEAPLEPGRIERLVDAVRDVWEQIP